MPDAHIIGEHYQVEGLIGQGGMGTVYHGVDVRTQMRVAIKELKPELVKAGGETVQRFEREAEALRKLNHPNIVKVLSSITEDGHHYIVMEYVEGGALDDILQETPQLPIERVLDIALDLSDALTRAHRLKIIHRDIKPANVLLREDGSPLLTDFGVARIGNTTRMTAVGTVVGTLAYLPPEALRSEPVDERLDIWAFGVMLYEMLAGVHPFNTSSTSTGGLLVNIMNQPVPDLFDYRSDVPWTLMGLVYWMLEKDPADRPSSVRLIGAMLENIMSGTVIPMEWFGENAALDSGEFRPNREEAIRAVMGYTTTAFRLDSAKSNTPTPTTPSTAVAPGITPAVPTSTASLPSLEIKTNPDKFEHTVSVSLNPNRLRRWLPWMFAVVLAVLVLLVLIVQPKPVTPPEPTSAEPATEAIGIAPVGDDEHMTLIANFERVNGEERDVTRFISENLRRTLEEDTPYSDIRVRVYPDVIRDADTARQIAQEYGAEVILWGSYDNDGVTANLQFGDFAKYPYITFERGEIEKLIDVSITMTSERRETLAYNVVAAYDILASMNGDTLGIGRSLLILKGLSDAPATVQGNGVAARFHRFITSYVDDPTTSLDEITEAISLDAKNPMLYAARALAYQRLGEMDKARADTATAERFAGKDWAMTLLLHVTDSFFTTSDYAVAYDYLDTLAKQRPNDWYALAFRGIANYLLGNFAEADEDIRTSIDLGPEINFPYTFAIANSLRQGDVMEVQRLFDEMLEKFPDPTLAQNLLMVSLSPDAANNLLVPMSRAFGNVTLRRWDDVLADTLVIVDRNVQLADPYFLRGIAFCNLERYEEAETSYTTALEIDDSLALAYILRAEVRQKQGNLIGAASDITTGLARPELERLRSVLTVDNMDKFDCTTFMDTDINEVLGTAEATSQATP